jgi:hypothetical protein
MDSHWPPAFEQSAWSISSQPWPLQAVLALAVILGALAVALALAAIDAETAPLHRLGHGRADQGCARNEQNRCRHGHFSTRLLVQLHIPLLVHEF